MSQSSAASPIPGTPEQWLEHAKSDLALAEIAPIPPGVLLESLCFHAQQAAEKAIKAVLVSRGITFKLVHDIAYLSELMPSVPMEVEDAAELNVYAVELRYPAVLSSPTEAEKKTAIEQARAVVRWAEAEI